MDALDGQQPSASMRERVPIPQVNRRSKRPSSLSKNMEVEESKFAVDPSLNDDALQRTQRHHAEASRSQPSPLNANDGVGRKPVHEQQPPHPYHPNQHSPSHPILSINHYAHPYTPTPQQAHAQAQGSSYPLGPPSWSLPSLAHSLPDSPGPHAAPTGEAQSSPSPGAFRAAAEMKSEQPASSGSGARSPSPPMAPAEAVGRGAVRLPPILQVEKQHVTTTATQAASASRRRNDAIFKCPVPGCGSTFTRRFNLRGAYRSIFTFLSLVPFQLRTFWPRDAVLPCHRTTPFTLNSPKQKFRGPSALTEFPFCSVDFCI